MKITCRLHEIDKSSIKNLEEPYSFREMLGLEFNARHNKNSTGAVWCEILVI